MFYTPCLPSKNLHYPLNIDSTTHGSLRAIEKAPAWGTNDRWNSRPDCGLLLTVPITRLGVLFFSPCSSTDLIAIHHPKPSSNLEILDARKWLHLSALACCHPFPITHISLNTRSKRTFLAYTCETLTTKPDIGTFCFFCLPSWLLALHLPLGWSQSADNVHWTNLLLEQHLAELDEAKKTMLQGSLVAVAFPTTCLVFNQ